MSDDLCYFEFLHAEAVKASRRICMRVQRGHTREEGEATTYKCGAFISSSVSSSSSSITF